MPAITHKLVKIKTRAPTKFDKERTRIVKMKRSIRWIESRRRMIERIVFNEFAYYSKWLVDILKDISKSGYIVSIRTMVTLEDIHSEFMDVFEFLRKRGHRVMPIDSIGKYLSISQRIQNRYLRTEKRIEISCEIND
jgi:hypothetical protein